MDVITLHVHIANLLFFFVDTHPSIRLSICLTVHQPTNPCFVFSGTPPPPIALYLLLRLPQVRVAVALSSPNLLGAAPFELEGGGSFEISTATLVAALTSGERRRLDPMDATDVSSSIQVLVYP